VCFSPGADAIVGTVVAGVGIDALRHVREKDEIPLASIPLVLGLHQLTETFVWLGLRGEVAESIVRAAMGAYLVVAFSVLPVLIPTAVGLVERSRYRRWVIFGCGTVGAIVAAAFTIALGQGPINVAIDGHHIAYYVESLDQSGGPLTAFYVLATCGALLASSHRDLELMGALNLAAVPILAALTMSGFASLWCFWAAIVSVVIAAHLRRTQWRATVVPESRRMPTRV